MPAAYDFVLDGVFSHIENGRVHFMASSGDELARESENQTIFALSEVYWRRIGCPTTYTKYRNGEQ